MSPQLKLMSMKWRRTTARALIGRKYTMTLATQSLCLPLTVGAFNGYSAVDRSHCFIRANVVNNEPVSVSSANLYFARSAAETTALRWREMLMATASSFFLFLLCPPLLQLQAVARVVLLSFLLSPMFPAAVMLAEATHATLCSRTCRHWQQNWANSF